MIKVVTWKIMLAVSGVNRCAYCSYLHTHIALQKGIDLEEVNAILSGDFSEIPEEQAVAIVYAQHWTEMRGAASDDARNRMVSYYGRAKAKYIEAYIWPVFFGNMCSNTVEVRGHGASERAKGLCFFLTYVLSLPIAKIIDKSGKRLGHSSFLSKDTNRSNRWHLECFA